MEIPDAYQEYVKTRRETVVEDRIATLMLPVDEMATVWQVIAAGVDSVADLPAETKRRWESILTSVAKSVREAA
jgi:hypothetical protein